ncbi:neurogenic locus protein delta isoform X2 [Toxorhynchites rutilus septentrionalis]|uniref:neurogenic locus protein delta isoform X2 n=1 Tax=Toxorhynchites rutilus septentrionalis TaxID=329112 RepID=UPI00247A31AA|nr:neurogenic locus protein delta isoform X2 [Toxorhynchites rutilus septentrionalis]
MNRIYFFSVVCLASMILIKEIECSGLFELKLKYFKNERGVDNEGACCTGRSDSEGNCIGACRTRFRACLKHYQAKIDTSSPCTFGDVITSVLEGNSLNLTEKSIQEGFENPIRFPFGFGWPGTFTLIVEAWLDTNETISRSPGVLISRLSIQRVLEVSTEWAEDSYNSSHTMLQYAFRVTCDASYYGAGCANLCRKRDDQFGHYTCSPTGERVCLSGWQGDYCTTPRCTPGCDELHGHCNKPNECICQSGWKGSLCNECEPYPGCMHGTCKKPWECLCNEGWGGLFCNQDLNFCTNHKPCHNEGICFNTGQGSYTCECPPGYTGTDCETRISDCAATPCYNGGICHDEKGVHGGYRCECQKGWIGTHCEKETITCAEKPCVHGTCIDTNLGFKCECPTRYSGTTCETQIDECKPDPCENGGICSSNTDTFQCRCLSGYSGNKCEINIDDCKGNPCENGGSCIDMVNQFRCQCVPGFIGSLCENKVDLCLTKPCANGGMCTNLNNDYSCECKPGFTGKDCSIDVDECSSSPCKNSGTCVNRVNSFQCVCAGGFRGSTCEEEALSTTWDSATGSISAHIAGGFHDAHSGRSDGLSNGQIVLIAIFSVATPLAAFIATAVVICMKRKRRREQEKDDAEARKQNEQNASHMTQHHINSVSSSKRSSNSALTNLDTSHHMIKNTWDKSVNNMSTSVSMDEGCLMNSSLYGGIPGGYSETNPAGNEQCYQANAIPTTLQRAKSQKQLNTDPVVMHRASQMITGGGQTLSQSSAGSAVTSAPATSSTMAQTSKEQILDKRISVLSDVSICNTRWSTASHNRQIVGPCSPPHV